MLAGAADERLENARPRVAPPQLGDVCGNGAAETTFTCRPFSLLRLCRDLEDPRWLAAGHAAPLIGPRANYGAEVRLRRWLRRVHPHRARELEWDSEADFVYATSTHRRAVLAVLEATARLTRTR